MDFEKSFVVPSMVIAMFGSFLGGFDYLIKAMLMLMGVDVVTGFLSAAVWNTSKYSENGVTSDALLQGALRKIAMLFIVSVGYILDNIIGLDYVRNSVVLYFIATEGISILEHMVHIGVPVPAFIIQMLETMQTQNDKKEDDADGKDVRENPVEK